VGCGIPCSHKCIIIDVGVLLAQNVIGKSDQQIVYASRFFNNTKQEVLTIVVAFHKFRHDLLGNQIVFYVDDMGLVYFVN
jgi:hypothetical protein